jgi:uridine kinase
MIGDRIIPKPYQTNAAEKLYLMLRKLLNGARPVVAISGESGCGKTEIAFELARFFDRAGSPAFIFQQDDYFHYPPKTNEEMRRKNIKAVGLAEVNLKRLDEHLSIFRQEKADIMAKPVVVFFEDRITRELIDPNEFRIAIVEGTYAALLNQVDVRIFIDRTYDHTREDRELRNRDKIDEFSEQILEIEHNIISRHGTLADILVDENFEVHVIENKEKKDKESQE